jgi:N6-L-threonylcarbamoyladenine synthase
VPTPALCTDNGAMIAALGDLLRRAGVAPTGLDLAADPSALLDRSTLP